jgi:trigger factor
LIKEKRVEQLGNASVKLTVTVAQDSVKGEYDALLKTYAATAQIKGFRKGHVPAEVLERKFGESIRAEASEKVLTESLKKVLDEIEEKPLPYSIPKLDGEFAFDLEKDLTFSVVYDVYPKIEVGEYKGLEVEVPQVTITAEDEKRELTTLQEQNAVVMDKDGGSVEAGNIVTVDYCELDEEGAEATDTKREDFVFTQGSGYNVYKIDDEVLGMSIGEVKTVEKSYPDDFENKDLAGSTKQLSITVKAIKERQLPEIDDDLAQDISDKYETLDDLKNDIRERLQKTLEGRLRQRKIDSIVEQVVAISQIETPTSMVDAELQHSWHNFVNQFRATEEQVDAMLAAQGKSREELLTDWRPSAEERLKGQLAVQKMLELEGIEVTSEEVDAEIDSQASSGGVTKEQIVAYYRQNNMMDYVERELKERKLFDAILEQTKARKGKKMSFVDLVGRNE